MSRTKPKIMAVHLETIDLQKEVFSKSLKSIFLHIDKDLHRIELWLVPIWSYLKDKNMASRLKKAAVKHIHISSNMKTHELDSFNNTYNVLSDVSSSRLRKLIMNVKAEEGQIFSVTMPRHWRHFIAWCTKCTYKI